MPVTIVVAPGSYKGTITSCEATSVIAEVLERELEGSRIVRLVLADGGEGTLEAFRQHFGGVMQKYTVLDPLTNAVTADVCLTGQDVAVIESAQAVGLSLLDRSRLDPWKASSYGVGQLIRRVVDGGASNVLVTMGDSAVMDMGVGMLDALGVKFYSGRRRLERPRLADLLSVTDFDDDALVALKERSTFVGLVDTYGSLCGRDGQVQLYGKQKGLRKRDVSRVELSFSHFAQLIHRRLGMDVMGNPLATGSGGLAATLHSFLSAPLEHTLDYLSSRVDFAGSVRSADVVITGEGCLDGQTKWGKLPHYLATMSTGPCLAIVGSYTQAGLMDLRRGSPNFCVVCLNPKRSIVDPPGTLREAAHTVAALLGVP